ncbi:MAG: hypothetical protein LBV04_00455 [Deferribacteraceae bacterium]|jgi:hypothetical protein|nr:hypothetical protein [Deferribacteraceae bacterium]
MSVVNIDNFRETMEVKIGKQVYEIAALTMHDYVGKAVCSRIDVEHGIRGYLISVVELLVEYTSIPRDVLEGLTRRQIEVLLYVLRGTDLATVIEQGKTNIN